MEREAVKNNILRKISLITGTLIIIVSSLMLVNYKQEQMQRRKEIVMAQEAFEKENKNRKMPDLRSIHKEEKTPVKERLKNEIGFVEIEKENILLPIFSGTSEKELRDGVGIVEDTDIPSSKLGNTSVLAGHRGGYNGEQSFLNIDKLEEGDKIKVSTTSGKLQYKVLNKKIIKNDDWSHFYRENDKSKLILMTCHPYPTNKERLLVISELEK